MSAASTKRQGPVSVAGGGPGAVGPWVVEGDKQRVREATIPPVPETKPKEVEASD